MDQRGHRAGMVIWPEGATDFPAGTIDSLYVLRETGEDPMLSQPCPCLRFESGHHGSWARFGEPNFPPSS